MTLFTSGTDRNLKIGLRYLAASAAVAAMGLIYELFSHGVFSAYMVFAFVVPLLAGAAPNLLAAFTSDKKETAYAGSAGAGLQLAAVATLTAGSLMQGVLDIYGTTNHLMVIYPVAGIAFLAAALLTYIMSPQHGQ
ncbi:MAG: hypothetical protein E7219_07215 [Clostridiales bacterium]|nr:hypothetical protein [Clostridiales bacterium]